MHVVTPGNASSRACGIGAPHRAHRLRSVLLSFMMVHRADQRHANGVPAKHNGDDTMMRRRDFIAGGALAAAAIAVPSYAAATQSTALFELRTYHFASAEKMKAFEQFIS